MAIHKKVSHVPRPPPRPTNLNEESFLVEPSLKPPIVLPLDQLWSRLPTHRRQEILQRFTQMIVQQLTPAHDQREASHE